MSRVDHRAAFRMLEDVTRAVVACERCPRLRAHCRQVAEARKREFRDESYWGRPVPGFGDPRARLLVVGLAPAAHGAQTALPDGRILVASYHPSRQNTNTHRLTREMWHAVFRLVRRLLDA
jgi:uracil-DNA glycosylase